jgi:hypothetical protein
MSKEWKRMLKERLYSKRRKGRPRMRWLDEVESDLKKMEEDEGWRAVETGCRGGQGSPRAVA